jgi:glucose/arabinose dehydrogenase
MGHKNEETMLKTSVMLMVGLFALSSMPAVAQSTVRTSAGMLQIAPMAEGLEEPWAIGFLPDGSFLVTERAGVLKRFAAAGAKPVLVAGLPEIYVGGQGGLLDIMIPQDFAQSREVWLSYSVPQGRWAGTALGRGTLSADGSQLTGFETVFEMPAGFAPKARCFISSAMAARRR